MATKQYSQWLNKGMQIAISKNMKNKEEYATLYADYMQESKIADQKLRRLESLSHQEHYKGVLNYAYARAQADLQKWSGSEKTKQRFSGNVPQSMVGLTAKMNDVQRFNMADTSTKQGILTIYQKRAETINRKYGRTDAGKKVKGWKDLTWRDVANYYEKEHDKELDSKMGSSTQMKALGRIKKLETKDKQKQAEKIQAVINGTLKVTDDEIEQEKIIQLLKAGVTPDSLFKN